MTFKPLTVLVGRNGAGKSNFLAALQFVQDACQRGISNALTVVGDEYRLISAPAARPSLIELEMSISLPGDRWANFTAVIDEALSNRGFRQHESLEIFGANGLSNRYSISTSGVIEHNTGLALPQPVSDRLYLSSAAGIPEFKDVYDAIMSMAFYDPNPDKMRPPARREEDLRLRADASNIAGIWDRLQSELPDAKTRIESYVRTIVPQIERISPFSMGGGYESIMFSVTERSFLLPSMSDGTLRAMAIIVAAMQRGTAGSPVRFVAIEEPETALHPAATGVLMDALHEAACEKQIVITTQSPDLLDRIDNETDAMLVAEFVNGQSIIREPDPASESVMADHLFTAGELLRIDQLQAKTDANSSPR